MVAFIDPKIFLTSVVITGLKGSINGSSSVVGIFIVSAILLPCPNQNIFDIFAQQKLCKTIKNLKAYTLGSARLTFKLLS